MLFNSLAFACFLPVVVAVFFLISHKHRWFWLLGASYFFYGYDEPAFVGLLLISSVVAYYCALKITKSPRRFTQICWLVASMITDLGMLFGFKYYWFFKDGVLPALQLQTPTFDAMVARTFLPAGISFYTFQNLSYVLDVFRGRIPAERHFGHYALFVSFFPQLVAGPIERAQALLPQLQREHFFERTRVLDGLKVMLWGLFQKIMLADRLAILVDTAYANPTASYYSGWDMWLATYLFAFQIYFDFCGYSLIAIGAAKMLGIELVDNFRHPYLAESISEFWRRWHISLMSWFRDYIYYPLGGNRAGIGKWCGAILLVFLLSGLWHGANWTFLVWGLMHASYILVSKFSEGVRLKLAGIFGLTKVPFIHKAFRICFVFNAVCLSWIFFRTQSLGDAFFVIQKIASVDPWQFSGFSFDASSLTAIALLLGFSALVGLLQGRQSPRHFLANRPVWLRWGICYTTIILIVLFNVGLSNAFIYFQF
jgi:D-alanyl-lipoteichoic acid acyltransferase DltB (MBOAT superfamily)